MPHRTGSVFTGSLGTFKALDVGFSERLKQSFCVVHLRKEGNLVLLAPKYNQMFSIGIKPSCIKPLPPRVTTMMMPCFKEEIFKGVINDLLQNLVQVTLRTHSSLTLSIQYLWSWSS